MYRSLDIDNLRQFDSLAIADLSRVNLIAGKNNAGKTTLLEALWLHSNAVSPRRAWSLRRLRGLSPNEPGGPFDDLFCDYHTDSPITIAARGDWGGLRILTISNQPRARRPLPISGDDDDDHLDLAMQEDAFENEVVFEYTNEHHEIHESIAWLDAKEDLPSSRSFLHTKRNGIPEESSQMRSRSVFIPAQQRGRDISTATRLGRAELAGRLDAVHGFLRIAEPRLSKLTVISKEHGGASVYGDIGIGRIIPIALLGGGIHKLLDLALSFNDARNGIIMIDEFETGLHYSVMEAAWRNLNRLSREFNVQVFATTHSYECMEAARDAFKEMEDDELRIHRISRRPDGMKATTYSFEGLDFTIDYGAEMR